MEQTTAERGLLGLKRRPQSPVAERAAELRSLVKKDPEAAQEQTWDWFKDLGKQRAHPELDELFALGKPPKGIDGRTDGILVSPFIRGVLDHGMTALAKAWMPWRGKRFDAANSRGDNVLTGSSRYVAKLFWPR